jgi:glycosyltransferase involved in cell wall biosynthesis
VLTERPHPLLVSVIIPAYNAEAFLRTTLASAQSQTWANLEIIIVDDGSTDATASIAEAAAQADRRVRVVRQEHSGVAAARNRGLAEARGDYVAPLDSDDVWHPQNLAHQMAALEAAGRDVALSYAWYVMIDEHGNLSGTGPQNQLQRKREILSAQIQGNFIGNASSTVIRRERIEAVGRYDCTLRARDAEGCEDQKLYIALAECWDFVAVPRYLIAYRNHPMSMSRDSARMSRSHALVVSDLRSRRPDLPSYWFGRGMARSHEADLVAALRRREWVTFVDVLVRAAGDGNWCLFDLLSRRLGTHLVAHFRHRFGWHTEAPEAKQIALDVSWATADRTDARVGSRGCP